MASTHKVKLAVKSVSDEKVTNLEEANMKEILNIDNDTPVVHSLSDGKIVNMLLNIEKNHKSSNDDIVNTDKKKK